MYIDHDFNPLLREFHWVWWEGNVPRDVLENIFRLGSARQSKFYFLPNFFSKPPLNKNKEHFARLGIILLTIYICKSANCPDNV